MHDTHGRYILYTTATILYFTLGAGRLPLQMAEVADGRSEWLHWGTHVRSGRRAASTEIEPVPLYKIYKQRRQINLSLSLKREISRTRRRVREAGG